MDPPGSPAFEIRAETLELHTELDRLEARGTFRIALRECGSDPRRVRAEEVAAVIERALPQASAQSCPPAMRRSGAGNSIF